MAEATAMQMQYFSACVIGIIMSPKNMGPFPDNVHFYIVSKYIP